MSDVKNGYNSKPTSLKFSKREPYRLGDKMVRSAELWIEQEGVERVSHGMTTYMRKGVPFKRKTTKVIGHSETLAYITLEELLNLRDEITGVIQELVA